MRVRNNNFVWSENIFIFTITFTGIKGRTGACRLPLCTINKNEMDYFNSRNKIIVDFDKHYGDELNELEKDISKITDLYLLLLSKKPEYCLKEKSEYLILILRSIEYLISATYLAKQRAINEMGNIVRLCIETSSMAIHIHSNNDIFRNYKQNNYKSTSAITYAKKHIKIIGELWGALSEMLVHPNTYHGILSEQIEKTIVETGEINLGFKPKNEIQDRKALLLLRISANIVLKCFQIIVTKKARLKGIEGLYFEEFDLFAFGKDTDEIIEELVVEFKNNSAQQKI